MKYLFSWLITLFTMVVGVKTVSGQNHPNNIEFDRIRVTTKAHKTYVPLHIKQQQLIKAFGKPAKVEKWHDEMNEKDGFKVIYQGANFYFIDDSLVGFDFEGLSRFEVGLADQNVYTGVGGSCNHFKRLKMIADGGGFFNVQHHGIDADEALSFENYKGTGMIQRIIYTDYNASQENDLKWEDLNIPKLPEGNL